ncbi:hypothetical protein Taro_055121 [Colocasia esculenta]|uniref:Uncharacterized protein n=1 Tax=Colocasia esculenta TaxID=4460 RepID=A0A843XSI0_COLES|nr:hypothetical protein [Colocasia esculenta]
MAADYWLAEIPLDADPYRRPHPWTSACVWRPDRWMSIGFTWSAQLTRDSSPLAPFSRPCNACSRSQREQPAGDYEALLLWPAEGGEVEVPPSPATRGHCTDVITATPWAQVRPWRSPNLLCFAFNSVNRRVNVVNRRPLHRQLESGGIRERPRDPATGRKRTVYTRDSLSRPP